MRLLLKLLVLVLAMALTVYLAEWALRLIGYEYRPMSVAVGKQEDARLFHLFQDEHFVYHPEMIWRPRPGYEIFNAQGFRGPELPAEKPPGEKWIFTVGDSNTLGWAGAEGAHWPGVLGELLAARDARIRVINAGVWGYTSFQGLKRLGEILPYGPDLVLVSFGSNDAHRVARPDADFVRSSHWGRELTNFLGGYRLGQLVIASRDRLTAKDARGEEASNGTVRVPLVDYRENLRKMARRVHKVGGEIVFLTRPFDGYIRSDTWWKNRGYDYNEVTAQVAVEFRVPLIDVYSFFKARSELFSDESHFTDEGHHQAAAYIVDELQPALRGRPSKRRAALRQRRSRAAE